MPAFGADLSGIWSGTLVDGKRDPQDFSFRFSQKGDTLTGKMYGDNESLPIAAVKISGAQISFSVTTELNGQISTFIYTGTVEGDHMDLTRMRVDAGASPAKSTPSPVFRLKRLT
jgi:hypothetical protein